VHPDVKKNSIQRTSFVEQIKRGSVGRARIALTDYGINDDFMKELAASLLPGNAALFVEIRKMTGDKVLDAIKGTGGVLDHTKEQALRDAIAAKPSAVAAATPTT
jgi:uncharacterized membrane protein